MHTTSSHKRLTQALSSANTPTQCRISAGPPFLLEVFARPTITSQDNIPPLIMTLAVSSALILGVIGIVLLRRWFQRDGATS